MTTTNSPDEVFIVFLCDPDRESDARPLFDEGAFLTRADADAYIEQRATITMNLRRSDYQSYKSAFDESAAFAMDDYKRAIEEHELLVKAGLRPEGKDSYPALPANQTFPDFDEWMLLPYNRIVDRLYVQTVRVNK